MAVTIYDVAKEAGVSIATVSKALNDSYTIPKQTKEMIRQIADRLGYRPNARAKNFARQAMNCTPFVRRCDIMSNKWGDYNAKRSTE